MLLKYFKIQQKRLKIGQNRSNIACFVIFIAIFVAFLLSGCARKGLVSQKYDPDFYQVPKLLPDVMETDPTYIVIGDTQADWRLRQMFYRKHNWWTWKMAIFPFYELYWLGNGAVGLVNRLRTVPDFGKDIRLMMREAVYDEWQASSADYILNTGDICAHNGCRPAHWAQFLEENMHNHPLLKEVPYLPTAGNHDRVNNPAYGRKNYEAVFDYPPFYTVESPNMALVVIDSNMLIDWKGEIEDNAQNDMFEEWIASDDLDHPGWLQDKLKQSDKPFKVVSMHHCPVSYGQHWVDWNKASLGQELHEKRARLLQLFQETDVQVVFSGHDHLYQRNILKDASGDPSEDIHFIVSSSGGVALRDPTPIDKVKLIRQSYRDQGIDVIPEVQFKAYHYCVVDVDETSMRVTTYTIDEEDPEDKQVLDEVIIQTKH